MSHREYPRLRLWIFDRSPSGDRAEIFRDGERIGSGQGLCVDYQRLPSIHGSGECPTWHTEMILWEMAALHVSGSIQRRTPKVGSFFTFVRLTRRRCIQNTQRNHSLNIDYCGNFWPVGGNDGFLVIHEH